MFGQIRPILIGHYRQIEFRSSETLARTERHDWPVCSQPFLQKLVRILLEKGAYASLYILLTFVSLFVPQVLEVVKSLGRWLGPQDVSTSWPCSLVIRYHACIERCFHKLTKICLTGVDCLYRGISCSSLALAYFAPRYYASSAGRSSPRSNRLVLCGKQVQWPATAPLLLWCRCCS